MFVVALNSTSGELMLCFQVQEDFALHYVPLLTLSFSVTSREKQPLSKTNFVSFEFTKIHKKSEKVSKLLQQYFCFYFRASELLLCQRSDICCGYTPVHKFRELRTQSAVTGPGICDESDVGHYCSKNLQHRMEQTVSMSWNTCECHGTHVNVMEHM